MDGARIFTEADYEAYLAELGRELGPIRVLTKANDPLSRTIDAALRLVTLGGQSAYMTRYVTTLGRTIYVPADWDARSAAERYVTMRHEAVHVRQFARFTFLGMAFLYLLPILPLGLALGRARLEMEAYAETFQAIAEVRGRAAAHAPELRAHVRRQFTSAAYGWMWPFPRAVDRWIDAALARVDTVERERNPSNGQSPR